MKDTTMLPEQTAQNFLEKSQLATVLISGSYQILYCSRQMKKYISDDQEQNLNGLDFLDYVSKNQQQKFFDLIESIDDLCQEWKIISLISESGPPNDVLLSGSKQDAKLSRDAQYLLVAIPLSELDQKELLRLLTNQKASKRFDLGDLDMVLDKGPIGIALLDNHGYIKDMNTTFKQHLRIEREDLRNKHCCTLFDKKSNATIRNLFDQLRKDKRGMIKEVLNLELKKHDHLFLELSLAQTPEDLNIPQKFIMITEDITNLRDTYSALIQSEKLTLTGRLAASLAHEINNPLQTSIGCLGLAEEILEDDDRDLRIYIRMAIDELQRSARIVKKLRDLNIRSDPSEKSDVNLQEVLNGVLVLTKNRMNDREIMPVFSYRGKPPFISASRDQIQQVMLNLIMNAIDALPEGGKIFISIVQTNQPFGYQITVRDTGEGMSPEIQQNLFNPFFTTKENGLGLGLYITERIINDLDGTINVESELNEGTSFSIWLPGLMPSKEKEPDK